jgi:predicted ATPase
MAEATGERFYSAELHRLRGELFALTPPGQKREAEASFCAAIKTAEQQGAWALAHKAKESSLRWQ